MIHVTTPELKSRLFELEITPLFLYGMFGSMEGFAKINYPQRNGGQCEKRKEKHKK